MTTPNIPTAGQDCQAAYLEAYGLPATWLIRAPGRVNLIGEHVDYNDGLVLPMAIEPAVWIAAGPSDAGYRFQSTHAGAPEAYFETVDAETPAWGNYVRGVFAGFQEASPNTDLPPLQAMVHSTVPMGGGLSSSAALEMAVATLLETVSGAALDAWDKVILCQKAEQKYAGVPCGFMDQFASQFGQEGKLLLLDCRSRDIQTVAIPDPDVGFLIINSNVSHDLTDGGYATRRAQCEEAAVTMGVDSLRDATLEMLEKSKANMSENAFKRARHAISENMRTRATVEAIKTANWPVVGELLNIAHNSLKDDFEVSTPELDLLIELAKELGPENGVLGARMTGGGFGGCVVMVVRSSAKDAVSESVCTAYQAKTGITATPLWTQPAAGAAQII